MDLTKAAFLILLACVGFERLMELRLSRRHQRALALRGAQKRRDPQYGWMVALHAGVLVGAALEVILLHRPLLRPWRFPLCCFSCLANLLRWWVIRTLGTHWNVEVMNSAPLGVVSEGPFRWVRHPNYLGVFVELIALPLIHTAWITAIAAAAGNALVLRNRLRVEEPMLEAEPSVPRGNVRQAEVFSASVLGRGFRSFRSFFLRDNLPLCGFSRSARGHLHLRKSALGPGLGLSATPWPIRLPPRKAGRARCPPGRQGSHAGGPGPLRARSARREIAALIVVKCRGNLNDSLKESLLRLSRCEPNLFPDFVGLEEPLGVELFEPPPKSLRDVLHSSKFRVLPGGIYAKTDLYPGASYQSRKNDSQNVARNPGHEK